ncbi:hypothetical protein B0H21DRAFT_119473 [Amylocystis lapponica]|nr:hypothetical protein B0H21DRAFT_119473 [Amylocystis lapponica]
MAKVKKQPTMKKDHIPTAIKRKVKEDGWDMQRFHTFRIRKAASTKRSNRGGKPADALPPDDPPVVRYSAGRSSGKPRAVSPLFLHDVSQPRLEAPVPAPVPQEPDAAISPYTPLHPHGVDLYRLHDTSEAQAPSHDNDNSESASGVDGRIHESPGLSQSHMDALGLLGMSNDEPDESGHASVSPASFVLSATSPGSAPYYLDGLQPSWPSGGCDQLDVVFQAYHCDQPIFPLPSDMNIADQFWTSPSLSTASSFSAPSPGSVDSTLQQLDIGYIAQPSEAHNQPVQATEVYQYELYRDEIMRLCGEPVDPMSYHNAHPSLLDDYNPATVCTVFQTGDSFTGNTVFSYCRVYVLMT